MQALTRKQRQLVDRVTESLWREVPNLTARSPEEAEGMHAEAQEANTYIGTFEALRDGVEEAVRQGKTARFDYNHIPFAWTDSEDGKAYQAGYYVYAR